MASSERISYSQIAEPNLLAPLRNELEQVNKILEGTSNGLKSVIEEAAKISKATPLDSFKNIEQVEKGIRDTSKAVGELDRIERDRVKLQQRLSDLDDDRIKANFELREQIRLQNKELRDNARIAASSEDAYKQLTAETNAAQAEFKRLAAQFGTTSEQAQEARNIFERLDNQLREVNEAARDGRRDVGRYEQGVRGLTRTFRRFASATIILKALDLLQNAVNNNSEGAANLEKIWVRVTSVFSVVASRLVDVFPIIQARFEQFLLSIRIGVKELTNLLGSNQDEIDELQRQYDELAQQAEGNLALAFATLGDEIAQVTRNQIQLIDDTLRFRREIVNLEKDIAEGIPTLERLRAEFENDSTSLEEQIRAGVEFRQELSNRFALEEQIASRRLILAQDNARANRNSVEAQEQLSAATLEYNQLVADQASEIAATEREIQKLRDDVTQLNLDFYLDDFDNRRTVNDRIIADETQTFDRRRDLLADNLKGAEEAFDLEEAALNRSLEERGRAQLDFDQLRRSSNSEEIAEIIRTSGISEPLAIRALEIIRDRRTALQDNADAQRDLNDAEAESRLLQDDIILQQQALMRLQEDGVDLEMVLNNLSSQRLQNEIDNLRERIAVTEEGSARFIELNQELNDRLLEQDQNRLEEENKLQEERLERIRQFGEEANQVFSLLSDLADQRSQDRIDAIDKELEAEENRADRLRELAEQGNEDAENNLALNEQRQAELELRRQRQIERQERQELAFAAIQAYSGNVQSGQPPGQALSQTISDISVLRAFINSLPGFYEGTEDTGTVSNPIDNKGGRLAILHDNERVIDKANNKLLGNIGNSELAMIVNKEKNNIQISNITSNFVLQELRELKQITKNKPTYMGMDYDSIADAVIAKVKKGNRLERIHKKNGGIWG